VLAIIFVVLVVVAVFSFANNFTSTFAGL